MSVSYNVCAGIGIKFDEETLSKFDPDLWDIFKEDWDQLDFLQDLIENYHAIEIGIGGDGCNNISVYYLFASDPIFGVEDFLNSMSVIGFTNLEKTDLLWVNELRVC